MEATLELARGLVPSLLLIGVLLLVRRGVTRGRIGGGGQELRVSSRTGLARGASVAVVEIDDRRFLVGASEHGVGLISELDPVTTAPDGAAREIVLPGSDSTRTTVSGPQDGWADTHQDDGPRSGLVHRLQQMTVRTHVEEPLREHL